MKSCYKYFIKKLKLLNQQQNQPHQEYNKEQLQHLNHHLILKNLKEIITTISLIIAHKNEQTLSITLKQLHTRKRTQLLVEILEISTTVNENQHFEQFAVKATIPLVKPLFSKSTLLPKRFVMCKAYEYQHKTNSNSNTVFKTAKCISNLDARCETFVISNTIIRIIEHLLYTKYQGHTNFVYRCSCLIKILQRKSQTNSCIIFIYNIFFIFYLIFNLFIELAWNVLQITYNYLVIFIVFGKLQQQEQQLSVNLKFL